MNIKERFNEFRFMDYGRLALTLSAGFCVLAILIIVFFGINLGLDFTGGTVVEIGYPAPVEIDSVRDKLAGSRFSSAVVQHLGDPANVIIRMNAQEDVSREILGLIQQDGTEVDLRLAEFIGAQVGGELREKGGLGLLLAIGMVLVYVAFRFQLKYALGAITALTHDVLLVVGFFSLFQLPFDLSVLAALMAVIGYSLNDSIVVADRIRENLQATSAEEIVDVINISLRQVFGRTLITSLTTLFVLVCLFLFSGDSIRYFALTLMLGVIIGTYSSIYISSNLLLVLKLEREQDIKARMEKLEKEGFRGG